MGERRRETKAYVKKINSYRNFYRFRVFSSCSFFLPWMLFKLGEEHLDLLFLNFYVIFDRF